MNSGAASSGNEFAAIAIFCGMTIPGNAGEHQEREAGEAHRRIDRRADEQRHEPRRQDAEHQLDQRAGLSRSEQRVQRGARVRECMERDGDGRRRNDRVDDAHRHRERRRLDIPVARGDLHAVVDEQRREGDRGDGADQREQRATARRKPIRTIDTDRWLRLRAAITQPRNEHQMNR